MHPVNGFVQHYAWGDPTFIPELLGVEPDGQPWSELWLGTHPNGPTHLADGTLLEHHTGELPYLLKVLAASRPLSLQTHPNAAQAEEGFALGIYPDPHAKPELLCALTPFDALCGVRPVEATLALLASLGPQAEQLAEVLAEGGAGRALEVLYRGHLDPRPVLASCSDASDPSAVWAARLATMYPGDPSAAVTLLLNLVTLQPGEALRLEAGNLHAYLRGAGVELMGNSDNVVRGGLTLKPVDVDELLRVVDPTPLADPVLAGHGRYELPTAGVALLTVEPGGTHAATGHELAVDLAGGQWYLAPGDTITPTATTYLVTPL